MCRWKGKAGPRFGMEGMDVMAKWKKKKRKEKPFHIKSLSPQVDHFHPWPFGCGSQQFAVICKPGRFMEMTGPVWT